MKLTWSVFALSDRDAIFTYIKADNPAAAVPIDERIAAAARRLLDFFAGTRELVINGTPYVAACATAETTVRILRYSMARKNGQKICPSAIILQVVVLPTRGEDQDILGSCFPIFMWRIP